MKRITSRDNPHFKVLKKLCQSGRERRKSGRILLDGIHLIESYVQCVGVPEEIVVSESGACRDELAGAVKKFESSGALSLLADGLFADLATVETPSGIMAVAPQPRCTRGLNQATDAVLLDGVQDPGNLGSILRSSAAAGFRQILLSTDCAQALSPKTLRAAMGAHFLLDIHEACNLCSFLGGYRGQTIVTALDDSTDIYALDLKEPVAWIFGSEGQGVRPDVSALVRKRVRIPMPGMVESLNVAAAAAICLFETVRQRQG
jgi:TrmH family RNA methyltransferase